MSLPSSLGPSCVGLRVVVRRLLPGETGPTGGPAMTDVLGMLEEWGGSTLTVRTEDGTRVVVERAHVVAGKPVPPRPPVRLRVPVPVAEHRALASWPAVEVERVGDWVLRASAGFSARANSALVLGEPGLPWDDAVARVVAFYTDRELPVWVQAMHGSVELGRLLDGGWVTARPGEADTGFYLAGVAGAARAVRRLLPAEPPPVLLDDRASEAWLADDQRALLHREAAHAVLEGPDAVAFATLAEGGVVVAKGRGALTPGDDPWLGITDVWVHPSHRRRGLAAVVLHALFGWAAERGAATAYLQARQDNAGALALYGRLGFSRHHSYRYLRAPDPG
ncbi:MAG TPA: GNAT family N-acetyltransferase [Marmoricola sp.]|nr:GNAT family N-acetyltransferase [Marmoricola sp.]